jgi:hypothetical protein
MCKQSQAIALYHTAVDKVSNSLSSDTSIGSFNGITKTHLYTVLARPSKEQMVVSSIFNIAILDDITVSCVQLLLLLSVKESCTTTVHQPNLIYILFNFKRFCR